MAANCANRSGALNRLTREARKPGSLSWSWSKDNQSRKAVRVKETEAPAKRTEPADSATTRFAADRR